MCEEPSEIGAELNPNADNLNVQYREFTLPSSVVFSDSVVTSNPSRYMVGVYDDPVFGKITASTYTQLGIYATDRPPSPIEPDAVFDSAFIYLRLDYYYGENFQEPQEFSVHELADTLFDVRYKSSIDTRLVFFTSIADTVVRITPGIDSLIVMRLDDKYGQEVMDVTIREQPSATGHPALTQKIEGIAFIPDEDMDYILGINTTVTGDSLNPGDESAVRIYYHRRNQDLVKFFDFTLNGTSSYIGVETDRSGSVLSDLTEPFTEYQPTDGRRYVQPSTGIYTKIDMSPVRNFIDSLNGFLVNEAVFQIGPVTSRNAGDYLQPLSTINLAFTNNTNKVNGIGLIRDPFNSVIISDDGYITQSNSAPLSLTLDENETLFEAEVSNFMQIMADRSIVQPDLMIFPSFRDQASMDQLIFDANSIKLKVFYTTLQ